MMLPVLIAACLFSAQAADSQYMGSGSQSGSGENYQQYMKEYSGGQNGDYQQYMQKYGGGGNSNYQQYMDKYAGGHSGDYQKYMTQYTGGQGGNYQQYMKKYAGGQGSDYQQYMQKYAGGQGGNYQQYMAKYTGGSQGGSQSSGNYASAVELSEKPPTKSSDSLHTLNLAAMDATGNSATTDATGSQGNYQQYMDKYAGSYEKYMKQYAGSYQKYQKFANYQENKECESSSKIASAHDAKTRDELNEWYTGEQQKVKCFVPDDYSTYASKDLDKEYKARLVELENPTPAAAKAGGQSPFMANDAVELIEKPKMTEKTQTAAKTFLAKSNVDVADTRIEKLTRKAENKSEIAQSEAASNMALFADQVKSDPMTVVGACSLGVAFACFVFFAVRHRQTVQLPVAQLG